MTEGLSDHQISPNQSVDRSSRHSITPDIRTAHQEGDLDDLDDIDRQLELAMEEKQVRNLSWSKALQYEEMGR